MAVDWHITVLQELVDCVAASECRRHSSLRAEVESTEEVKGLPVMPYRAIPIHTVLCCVLCCAVLYNSAPEFPSSLLYF